METLRFLLVASFYPPYHLGGDAAHVRYLAEALATRGHEVHVEFAPAAYRLKKSPGAPMPGEPQDDLIHRHPIPSLMGRAQPIGAYLTGRSRSVSRFHESLVHDLQPDVVHYHNISLLGLGILDAGGHTPAFYTAHDYWLRCPRSDLFKFGRYPCDRPTCVRCCLASGRPPQLWRSPGGLHGLERLRAAIAPSRFMMEQIRDRVPCPVVHIPNFAPDPNPGGQVAEPSDYYLFVGVLEHHKGILELAQAAENPAGGFRLIIAGRGSQAPHLKAIASAGRGHLEMKGWLDAAGLAGLYARARGLVIPSLSHENAPLAAIEALAWGTPLLVSRRGGLEELLDAGTGGIAFDPTPSGIQTAVQRFEAEDLPHRLRVGARHNYENTHLPGRYLERYLAVLSGGSLERQAASIPKGLS